MRMSHTLNEEAPGALGLMGLSKPTSSVHQTARKQVVAQGCVAVKIRLRTLPGRLSQMAARQWP